MLILPPDATPTIDIDIASITTMSTSLPLSQLPYQVATSFRLRVGLGRPTVFLDAGLPDIQGVEVGKRIRILEKNNKTNRMPIILLSAYPSNSLKKWCQEAEIDNFSTKPIPYKDLYIMLENIFNQKAVNNEFF